METREVEDHRHAHLQESRLSKNTVKQSITDPVVSSIAKHQNQQNRHTAASPPPPIVAPTTEQFQTVVLALVESRAECHDLREQVAFLTHELSKVLLESRAECHDLTEQVATLTQELSKVQVSFPKQNKAAESTQED